MQGEQIFSINFRSISLCVGPNEIYHTQVTTNINYSYWMKDGVQQETWTQNEHRPRVTSEMTRYRHILHCCWELTYFHFCTLLSFDYNETHNTLLRSHALFHYAGKDREKIKGCAKFDGKEAKHHFLQCISLHAPQGVEEPNLTYRTYVSICLRGVLMRYSRVIRSFCLQGCYFWHFAPRSESFRFPFVALPISRCE